MPSLISLCCQPEDKVAPKLPKEHTAKTWQTNRPLCWFCIQLADLSAPKLYPFNTNQPSVLGIHCTLLFSLDLHLFSFCHTVILPFLKLYVCVETRLYVLVASSSDFAVVCH